MLIKNGSKTTVPTSVDIGGKGARGVAVNLPRSSHMLEVTLPPFVAIVVARLFEHGVFILLAVDASTETGRNKDQLGVIDTPQNSRVPCACAQKFLQCVPPNLEKSPVLFGNIDLVVSQT